MFGTNSERSLHSRHFLSPSQSDGRVVGNARRGRGMGPQAEEKKAAPSRPLVSAVVRPTDEGDLEGSERFAVFAECFDTTAVVEVAQRTATYVASNTDAIAAVSVEALRASDGLDRSPSYIEQSIKVGTKYFLVRTIKTITLPSSSLPSRRSLMAAVPKMQQETTVRWAEHTPAIEIITTSTRVRTRLTKLGYTFTDLAASTHDDSLPDVGWHAVAELGAVRFRKVDDGKVIRRTAVGAAAERHARRTATGSGSLRPLVTPPAIDVAEGIVAAPDGEPTR
jgi:hypothetical protein